MFNKCKHEWEEIEGTSHLMNAGLNKIRKYKCKQCYKEKWFTDTSNVPFKKHLYLFREKEKGNISDGSHTFNELYYHRMILFSIICNTYKDKAWKSWKHSDNTMFDDYFIVGITTEKGDYSYHYHKRYWDMFNVKELENAPEWDGHKPEDIDRLLNLIK